MTRAAYRIMRLSHTHLMLPAINTNIDLSPRGESTRRNDGVWLRHSRLIALRNPGTRRRLTRPM